MKAHSPFVSFFKENKDIGQLMLRLFLGLRLTWGGLRKFVESERLDKFSDLLDNEGLPYPAIISAAIFLLQFIAGVSIMAGWKIRWSSLSMLFISILLLFIIPPDSIFLPEMPPVATSFLCAIFLLVSPGRYTLHYRRLKKIQQHTGG